MNAALRPGLYRHFKGNLYRVLGLVRHSESLEPLVLYQALYGEGALWVRPQEMFEQQVEHEGNFQPRFAYLRPFDGADTHLEALADACAWEETR